MTEIEGDLVSALLHEIQAGLRSLVEKDEGVSIDLAGLPLSNEELDRLDEILGDGEVYAQLESRAMTEVRETAYRGVWWITHRNEAGAVIAEFIEVTYCPEILMTPEEDVKESADALRASLLEAEYLN